MTILSIIFVIGGILLLSVIYYGSKSSSHVDNSNQLLVKNLPGSAFGKSIRPIKKV
jgi:hypothetical protein